MSSSAISHGADDDATTRRRNAALVVLMISGSTTLQLIQLALKNGAAGFVTKTGNTDD